MKKKRDETFDWLKRAWFTFWVAVAVLQLIVSFDPTTTDFSLGIYIGRMLVIWLFSWMAATKCYGYAKDLGKSGVLAFFWGMFLGIFGWLAYYLYWIVKGGPKKRPVKISQRTRGI